MASAALTSAATLRRPARSRGPKPTFWSTVMWTIIFSVLWLVSLLLSTIVIGIPFLFVFWGALFLLMIWFTVKSIFGLINLLADRTP